MNLSEAKKFLNDNGYLLEDRFGGGKDRYGHKIKRLKLSDLDNEDEHIPAGDVEPSDFVPAEAPTENPKAQPVEIKNNADLLELTYTTLEDANFPGYIDYDESGTGLTLVIHDLLHNDDDYLNRASKIFGDIEETTNEKYDDALASLSYYLEKDKKNMETKIKGFLIDYIDFVKFNLRESGCDNILSVDVDLDYEYLYNSCSDDVEVYVEQLKGFNRKCDLVRQYLANWVEVNLGTK
ncbi:MAG: hypothetical protein J6V44_04045 [Methanobrevibacter sp.]|nr:hypothetical protein [Methanobrevibacter sp.]